MVEIGWGIEKANIFHAAAESKKRRWSATSTANVMSCSSLDRYVKFSSYTLFISLPGP